MKNPNRIAGIALVVAILALPIGCKQPPEAGSLDPHGPYTAEEARAAGMAALKARGAAGRPHGAPASAPSTN